MRNNIELLRLESFEKVLFPVFLDGEFFVKKYRPKFKENYNELKSIKLKYENPQYLDLYADENSDFVFWGKVTWNLHKL